MTYTSFPKVVNELEEWAHSHLSACLDEFNAEFKPSGTWSKLSDRANFVEGHTVILGMVVHGIPADKRDLPPALVFCADRLYVAHISRK